MLHVQCLYSTDCGNKCGHVLQDVVNTAGFYTEERGRGAGIPPSPSLTQKSLNWVWLLFSQVLNNNLVPDCVTSNLRGSKFQIFWGGGGGGGGVSLQTPLVGMHTYACVSVLSHATIILLPSCSSPPKLKILYETLNTCWSVTFAGQLSIHNITTE